MGALLGRPARGAPGGLGEKGKGQRPGRAASADPLGGPQRVRCLCEFTPASFSLVQGCPGGCVPWPCQLVPALGALSPGLPRLPCGRPQRPALWLFLEAAWALGAALPASGSAVQDSQGCRRGLVLNFIFQFFFFINWPKML